MNWREEREKSVAFLQSRLKAGDDIYTAARKAWAEEGYGLMTVKQAVQMILGIESREAARVVAKATFEVERKRPIQQNTDLK